MYQTNDEEGEMEMEMLRKNLKYTEHETPQHRIQ